MKRDAGNGRETSRIEGDFWEGRDIRDPGSRDHLGQTGFGRRDDRDVRRKPEGSQRTKFGDPIRTRSTRQGGLTS
jgi:hypothetical protein